MRILNYLELEDWVDRSGIGTATAQQRGALERTDVEVLTDPWTGGSLPRAAAKMVQGRHPIREVDLVHCNLIGPGSIAVARTARRRNTPLVLHAHVTREDFAGSFRGSTTFAPALGRYLKWYYSQADLVLCPSEYTRGVLQDYPIDPPIEVISNGVDLEDLAGHETLRDRYRERYDLDGTVVFAVGNVFERKGLETFCKVAETSEHTFAWFGKYETGPIASSTVRRRVNNPPSNLTFTGWVEDRRGAFAAGDIFCFPAHVENQGIVVLEAMACERPVVVRDIPVFREYFTDGEDCILCSSTEEFREAIERISTDEELRDRLVSNGRETAEAHGLDRVAETLETCYDRARRAAAESG